MRITCPACTAKYSIADEKVQDRLAKIRCRKCGTTIVIDGKVSPASVYTADGAAAAPAGSGGPSPAVSSYGASASTDSAYTVDFGDNDQRTLTIGQLVDAYNTGEVVAETYVWTEGMADWAQLGQVAEIVDALYAAAGAGDAGGGYAQPAAEPSSPWSEHPHAGGSAGHPAVSAARGQDLFGRYAVAGSEEEVTTSAPQDMAPAAATGARNESSVLFSLSALTASASSAPMMSAPPPTNTTNDDSGLIDLKALTAASEKPKADPAPATMGALGLGSPLTVANPLGVASPLGMPAQPQPVAPDLGPVNYPAPKSRTGLFIGGAIALGAVIIALALILRPEPPPPVVPTVDTSLVAQPVLPTPTQQELVAQPPPTTGDEADAGPDKAKKKSTRRWRRSAAKKKSATGSTASSSSSKSSGAKSSAAPKKTAGPCGCAPGDLMCNMKCSAKGGR